MPESRKQQAAREVLDILEEISTLLNTGMDRTALSLCVSLIENGVNPEALAAVIKDLRRESEQLGILPPDERQKEMARDEGREEGREEGRGEGRGKGREE